MSVKRSDIPRERQWGSTTTADPSADPLGCQKVQVLQGVLWAWALAVALVEVQTQWWNSQRRWQVLMAWASP